MKNTLNSLLKDRAVMEDLVQDRASLQRQIALIGQGDGAFPRLESARSGDGIAMLDVLLDSREAPQTASAGLTNTEAIILLRGRPVLLVQEDKWEQPRSAEIAKWLGNPDDADNHLRRCLPSIGRVEIVGDADEDYIGTGWMLDEDIMITNRHVAEAFGVKRGSAFSFRQRPDGNPMRVRADFKREYQRTDLAQAVVQELLYMAPPGDIFPDMALLRLERSGLRLPAPIALDDKPLRFDAADPPTLAVIGYPAEDSRNDAMASREIFDGIYRVKRLSPGRVMTVAPNGRLFEHDCTTLGGNSGSPIFNLATGKACGLHFAGTYRSRNYAATAGWLKMQMSALDTRRVFLPPEGGLNEPAVVTVETPQKLHNAEHFTGRDGYQIAFLGDHPDVQVPLPSIDADLNANIATAPAVPLGELKYCHFSVVMRTERRLPFFTAVNIDGSKLFNFPRGKDVWFLDGRLDPAQQEGEPLYIGNPLDRGHLVRRLDPAWGDTREEAKLAEEDTFHFTNCSPQHEALNQRTWLSLEDYILGNANTLAFKVSVFSGPVMAPTDALYRGIQLPQAYWKVAVMVNVTTGALSATGYLLSQAGLVEGLEFLFGPHRTYQVPLSLIESKTGLHFDLNLYDPLARTEGKEVREINGPGDLVL